MVSNTGAAQDDRNVVCDICGVSVPESNIEFSLNEDGVTLAWDHRVHSEGECSGFSALRNGRGSLIEESARYAGELNSGAKRHSIKRILRGNKMDLSAYYVSDVRDLMWLSANVLYPIGAQPRLMISKTQPQSSSLRSMLPVGVNHVGEPVFLVLVIGDWLVVGDHGAVRAMSNEDFHKVMNTSGVSDEEIERLCSDA